MSTPKIMSIGGFAINLATVKSIKQPSSIKSGKTNMLIIEHITRYEYVFNPNTQKYVEKEIKEISEIDYGNYETARDYRIHWEDAWQGYLDSQDN